MKVTFYYRKPNILNRSIERVFETISGGLIDKFGIRVSNLYVKSLRMWQFGMVFNILRFGFNARMNKGIHHITGDIHYVALFMPRDRTVLTIHDLVSLHNEDLRPMIRKFISYVWYLLPLRHLKYITCISESTKKDLLKYFPFVEHKLTVIPNPIPDRFVFMPLEKHEVPIVLHIGTRSNKNLERVIEALSTLRCHLRIIGSLTPEQLNLLQFYKIYYSNACGISDDQMIEEYRNCDVVSFPSLFEGFGMPIIEGQACGRIVVTSNIEPMSSISGEASVLVDPYNVESIRNGFRFALKESDKTKILIQTGLDNARKYTSGNVIDNYKMLYDKML